MATRRNTWNFNQRLKEQNHLGAQCRVTAFEDVARKLSSVVIFLKRGQEATQLH